MRDRVRAVGALEARHRAERGHRIVVAGEIGLGVAHQVKVGRAAAWLEAGAQFTLYLPVVRRASPKERLCRSSLQRSLRVASSR